MTRDTGPYADHRNHHRRPGVRPCAVGLAAWSGTTPGLDWSAVLPENPQFPGCRATRSAPSDREPRRPAHSLSWKKYAPGDHSR